MPYLGCIIFVKISIVHSDRYTTYRTEKYIPGLAGCHCFYAILFGCGNKEKYFLNLSFAGNILFMYTTFVDWRSMILLMAAVDKMVCFLMIAYTRDSSIRELKLYHVDVLKLYKIYGKHVVIKYELQTLHCLPRCTEHLN